jgi:hypothetical protein
MKRSESKQTRKNLRNQIDKERMKGKSGYFWIHCCMVIVVAGMGHYVELSNNKLVEM